MVGILLSFWEGLFPGAMLVLGRVVPGFLQILKKPEGSTWKLEKILVLFLKRESLSSCHWFFVPCLLSFRGVKMVDVFG